MDTDDKKEDGNLKTTKKVYEFGKYEKISLDDEIGHSVYAWSDNGADDDWNAPYGNGTSLPWR